MNEGWKSLGFENYNEFLLSDFWKNKREWILSCFDNECQICKSKEKLEVHHLNYISVGNEGMDDVTVLCRECHNGKHKKRDICRQEQL